MKDIYLRTKQLAEFMIATNSTVRKAAHVFGISKSTVHYDLTKRLPHFDISLYNAVKKVLEKNLIERSKRGGLATKAKYKIMMKR